MKIKLILFAIILIIISAFFIPNLFYGREEKVQVPPRGDNQVESTLQPTNEPTRPAEVILARIQAIIQKEDAIFGIEVYELKTGRRYGINQENIFHAASVGKLVVAAYALTRIDQGKANFDQLIDGVSLNERLRLMINQSDNGSWESLLNHYGYTKIHQFEKNLGLLSTNVYENTSTAKEINSLLVKIYQGNLLSDNSKGLLLGWMQNTEREERIPQAVPKGTTLYHKAGTFEGETHDAGIIIHPQTPFALTILSLAKYDTSPVLREITRAVYDFYSKN